MWAAVFVRDGEPWYLNGALVGMESSPPLAVAELLDLAQHLVIHGANFLTEGQIPLEDRIWLFKLLDMAVDSDDNQKMYIAVREANGGVDPYYSEYSHPQEGCGCVCHGDED
jgi:hypothetical protein